MKPRVLTFVRYYLPGFRAGGPIRTIANMVERLSDSLDFRIVALDRDLGDARPYPDVQADSWVPRGKALVQHVSPDGFGLRKVAEIARKTPHDVMYLNSFFDPRFTQQVLVNRRFGRLAGRPIVLAPRGEFSEGALRLKRVKKGALIRLARSLKLYDDLTWQASSGLEAEDILRTLGVGVRLPGRVVVSGHLAVASDPSDAGVSLRATDREEPQLLAGAPLRACFLSRISPKKNLDFAIRVLARVHVPVRFTIYGPIEDADYWAGCVALIATLPPNIEVVHEGELEPAQVVPTLQQHDLFLFPTRGENFGHVIHEALRAGLPLLISDQTPWRGLAEEGIGWDLPLSDEGALARRIEEVSGWSCSEQELCAARARAYAIQVGEDPGTLEANRRLFLDAISRAS